MFDLKPIRAAVRSDVAGGALLIGAAVLALVWANSPWADAYESLRSATFGPSKLHLHLSVETWAADGLLAVFFFIVGNELKQEFVHGELRDPRRALLPIVAALGGVVVPAGIFLVVNATAAGEEASGWGVPMATDIAFAVAVLAVVGRHLPVALRTFLLTLATVDDLCAVLVIAVAYTSHLSLPALGYAATGLLVFWWLQNGDDGAAVAVRRVVPGWLLFGVLAVGIWTAMHASGVHTTIAGVAMGMLMRTTPRAGQAVSPSHHVEHVLRPFSQVVALPVFALMAAGVALGGADGFWTSTITWGVVAGLVVGKIVGIFGASWLTARFTSAHLNPGLAWIDIAGVGVLGGVGFTVSLLIAELSYTDPAHLTDAKAAVLLASTTAAILAALVLGQRSRHYKAMAVRRREDAE
nr:Na+/H+ antiporter NhaA [Kribbella italica]